MARGSEDPLDTRRSWEEAKAEQKRWAMQCSLIFDIGLACRPWACKFRAAQLAERGRRATFKLDAAFAAQQAQVRLHEIAWGLGGSIVWA